MYVSCSLNSVSISNDSSLLSGGFEDSSVRVWSLTPKKLRMLKSPSELAQIDKEAGKWMGRHITDRALSHNFELFKSWYCPEGV